MLKVHVWDFQGKNEAWGHASADVGSTYISWWPATPGQVPSKIHRNVYSSHPIRNRTFFDDARDERGYPNHNVNIEGLDESAIKDWWQSIGLTRDGVQYSGPLLPWSTLTRNCSTVVATALQVGGGDKYASWFKSWNVVWTPSDVLAYARSIELGLLAAKR
jgi:hypothetical protein